MLVVIAMGNIPVDMETSSMRLSCSLKRLGSGYFLSWPTPHFGMYPLTCQSWLSIIRHTSLGMSPGTYAFRFLDKMY